MAPAIQRQRPRVVSSKRVPRLDMPVWTWTVGDDSDGESDVQLARKVKRRLRRQATPPVAPPEDSLPAEPNPDDPSYSSGSSESDGISSESDDDTGAEDQDESPSSGGEPTAGLSSSSTTTFSQSFTTLIPGSGGRSPDELEGVEIVSRTITSLTPILTIAEPETTYTSYSVFTTVDELASIVSTVSTLSSSSTSLASTTSDATRAAQTSAAADADTSPEPSVIRVHHHPHGLSKDAIHGLIAFGALGGLMGFLAVAWFFWRRYKRRHRDFGSSKSSESAFARPSRRVRFLAQVPFLKDRFANRSWFNIDEPYFKDNNNSRTSVFLEKSVSVKSASHPRLDSQFFAPNQVMGVAVRVQAGDQPPSIEQNVSGGFGHHAGGSISSTSPERSHTIRTQQPPFPVNSNKRVSEISSLSSGFGDGELLVPTGQSTMERLPQPPPSAKFSDTRRDTVYTEASEDQPPRFRNVNSWVRQQTGRVKRSQARTQADDAPPVPQMPAEEDYGMMLPDGEEPRRPQNQQPGLNFGFAK